MRRESLGYLRCSRSGIAVFAIRSLLRLTLIAVTVVRLADGIGW